MPLRLFGGQGSGKVRTCPACEREIAAEASFCPSCYMVIRPGGSAELREYLRGRRIPTDVYLLRKMQVEDPNAGPVIRVSGNTLSSPPVAEAMDTPPAAPVASAPLTPQSPGAPAVSPAPPAKPVAVAPVPAGAASGSPRASMGSPSKGGAWTGVHSLVRFVPPLPPPTPSVDETPALLGWMLEKDPLIPNNTELLEVIHADAYRDGSAARLGYRQHLLLQIADDLLLHPTHQTLSNHLALLAAAYRRAASAYHTGGDKGEKAANTALWQMSSMASRLRVEAWVYQSRHGVPPEITRPRRPRVAKLTGD